MRHLQWVMCNGTRMPEVTLHTSSGQYDSPSQHRAMCRSMLCIMGQPCLAAASVITALQQ